MRHSMTIQEIMLNGISYIANPDSKVIIIKDNKVVLIATLDSNKITNYVLDTVEEITLTRIEADVYEITIHI